ncbi:phosphatidylinositol transfer protein [Acrasis kona]|uniref:Phosphatidylinositol transfer protein n=1 Tax=Acrasis kona TaxID=1008807 RepID=A0AAW2Z731_9EUKA
MTEPTVPTSRTDAEEQKLKLLNEEQRSVFEKISQEYADRYGRSDEEIQDWQLCLNVHCLLKFCTARNFVYEDVKSLIDDWSVQIQWRLSAKPHLITRSQVENELDTTKAFWHGFDKEGRPIAVIRAHKHVVADRDYDECVLFALYTAEKGLNLMREKGVERYNIVYDAGQFGYKNFDLALSKDMFKLMSYYAETLNNVYVLNANWVYRTILKIVKPFMDPVTFSKIKLLEDPNNLFDYVSRDQILVEHGGNDTSDIQSSNL